MIHQVTRRYLPRTAHVQEAVLTALRQGHNIETTVRLLGVSRSALRNWRKEDATFGEAFEKARIEGVAKIVEARLQGVADLGRGARN